MTRALALLLTVLTGFTGLVYEVTWQKGLAILLGSHAEATAAVLGIFLGGLSVGYALFGWVSRRRLAAALATGRPPRLLLVYGAVEAGIGVWALAFPVLFAAALGVSVWLPFGHGALAFVADVGLAALLIGPPTVLMGGTIPLLTQALAHSLNDATRFHALVYGLNATGAFVGALAAAFVLIPALGIPDVLRVMGVVNLVAGGVFAVVGVRGRGEVAPAAAATPAPEVRVVGFAPFAAAALLLGFAMMAIQTVLIRVAGLSFGASHFTFAMVVAVFVLCISAGSLFVSAFSRIPRVAVVLCPVLLAATLAALYPVMDQAPWGAHLIRVLFRDLDAAFLPYHGAAFLGMLAVLAIPVGLSGASLPLMFHELRRVHGELGSVAGRLYSWNTVGNLLGALLGGYALLYWVDLHHVYRLGVAAVVVAAALLLTRLYPLPRAAVAGVLLVVLGGLWALPGWAPEKMSGGLFRTRSPKANTFVSFDAILRASKLVVMFHDDDPVSTVTVKIPEKEKEMGRAAHSIFNNGKSDGSLIGDYPTMSLVALIPCLIADSCQDAFVIGFGTGVTVGEFAALDSTERVVVAEISPAVLEAAPLFDPGNLGASKHPKVQFQRGDAYRALLRDETAFDVIASEPSNPWVSGVEMLFSREFLEAARDRLRPGGVYAQWIHTYETDRETLELVLATYTAVFDRVAVWFTQSSDLLLLGLMPDADLDLDRIEERFQHADLAAGFRRAGITSFPQLLAHEIVPLGVLQASALSDHVHTLLHPRLSDRAARAFFRGLRADLPPTAGAAAAEAGARSSLLRAWIERQGGLTPELRRTITDVLCPDVPPLCMTALARWRHDEPDSPELAERVQRHLDGDVMRLATLMSFYDDGLPAPLTPAKANWATEKFGLHYYHALPFERAALDETWKRCRLPECWPARREARVLLGEPAANGDEPEPPPPESAPTSEPESAAEPETEPPAETAPQAS
jgi:predicted membrane-bound spermidine synthase